MGALIRKALVGSEKLFGLLVGVAGDTQNASGDCGFAVWSLVWRRVEEGELICPLLPDTNKLVNMTCDSGGEGCKEDTEDEGTNTG